MVSKATIIFYLALNKKLVSACSACVESKFLRKNFEITTQTKQFQIFYYNPKNPRDQNLKLGPLLADLRGKRRDAGGGYIST